MKESLEPDTTISHYRILSKLGAGGMGEVYPAQNTTELERTLVKPLRPSIVLVVAKDNRANRQMRE